MNRSLVEACGIGNICLHVGEGDSIITLQNALYIPEATVWLISITYLTEDLAGSVLFTGEKVSILKSDSSILAVGSHIPNCKLWCLDCSPVLNLAHVTTPVPDLETWHCHLGHTNNQAIFNMFTKGFMTGMRVNLSRTPSNYHHCIFGKQVRSPVPKERSN